jgi:hypothetical protein
MLAGGPKVWINDPSPYYEPSSSFGCEPTYVEAFQDESGIRVVFLIVNAASGGAGPNTESVLWYGLALAAGPTMNSEYILINATHCSNEATSIKFRDLVEANVTAYNLTDTYRSHMEYEFFFGTSELHELGHVLMGRGNDAHHTTGGDDRKCIMTSVKQRGNGIYHLTKMCSGETSCWTSCNHWGVVARAFKFDEPLLVDSFVQE